VCVCVVEFRLYTYKPTVNIAAHKGNYTQLKKPVSNLYVMMMGSDHRQY
jgi:hypothetical protein